MPAGVAGVYCHPAAGAAGQADCAAEGYYGPGELAALLDGSIARAIRERGIAAVTFSDLPPPARVTAI